MRSPHSGKNAAYERSAATLTHCRHDRRQDQGGRIFFSSTGRTLEGEDEICLLTVGVDIGSSTSHLVFSRIVLERLDSRYVVSERETFYGSDILLTPYSAGRNHRRRGARRLHQEGIRRRQGRSGRDRHRRADPDRRRGAAEQRARDRRIVRARRPASWWRSSAGDSLETIMAAYGSGAVARSIRDECDGDERRRRRRHLEDRGLRRRQGRSTSPRSTSARG